MPRRKSPKKPFTIKVEQRPVVKGRPRLGRKGRVFTPERTLIAEAIIADQWRKDNAPYYETPVMLEATFTPTSTEITITPLDPSHASKLRGDTDNYLKLVCDALNGVAYPDDKAVMVIRGEKQ
jgi:Holliday junction resolvase RusA-like endonuclease